MARVVDHLSVTELEHRFKACPDPVEARHEQVIWLPAQGHTIGATSKVCRSRASLTPGLRRGPDAGDFREEPGAGMPHARICEGEAEWPSYSTTI